MAVQARASLVAPDGRFVARQLLQDGGKVVQRGGGEGVLLALLFGVVGYGHTCTIRRASFGMLSPG